MDLGIFIQGMIIGLTLAVPVGPISLVCIHRTITAGRLHGILSGLGVATADSFYAAVSILGLTIISGLILSNQVIFRCLAGIILILIGIRVFLSVPAGVNTVPEHETYHKDFLSLLAVALANPLTLLFFIAILPGFGVMVHSTEPFSAAGFVAGVFFGSMTWWILLCGSVGSVRSRISTGLLQMINRISGLMILCFGIGLLVLVIGFSKTHFLL
jgi:threonine/homoserine/homoserine lactone efflux protein